MTSEFMRATSTISWFNFKLITQTVIWLLFLKLQFTVL